MRGDVSGIAGGRPGRGGPLRLVARRVLGPAYHQVRRELQWRDPRVHFGVRRDTVRAFPFEVARHASPLFRPLVGLDVGLQRNKVTNLRIAAARLDGVVLEPGVRLSFWREVGAPTRRRGFLDGMVLDHGRVIAGVGGGLCQMTNLLHWMTLHTPLTVVERWRHSYDVFPDAQRALPFGSGATCAWPALDLQIENRTLVPFRLTVAVTDTELVGTWTSTEPLRSRYEIVERAHRVTHEGPRTWVRHNQLWRLEHREGSDAVSEALVTENHALMMYEPFLPVAASQPE